MAAGRAHDQSPCILYQDIINTLLLAPSVSALIHVFAILTLFASHSSHAGQDAFRSYGVKFYSFFCHDLNLATPWIPVFYIKTPMHKHKRVLHCLNLGGSLKSTLLLEGAHLGLGAHDTTTPLSAGLVVLVHEAILDGGDELGELSLVLGADLGEGEDSSGLLVDDGSETGLALDNGVGDTHLLAERGQEDDELDGVDVVGDQDEGSLLVLNQADNVVETVLDGVGLLGDILLLLALLDGGGLLQETLLLLGLGLRAVLVEELESLGGGVLVEDGRELRDSRGNLDAHLQDLLLALETDILGPLNHAGQVTLGLDVLADAEVAGAALDERVLGITVSTRSSGTHGVRSSLTLGAFLEPAFP